VTGAAGSRLAVGSAWAAAVVATLARPLSWALGLLGFLVGGGLVLVAWPILALPTPTGVQTMLGAPVTTLVFGVPAAGLVLLAAIGTLGGFVFVAGAVTIGAWAERHGIRLAVEAAAEEGAIGAIPLDGAPGTLRVAVLRLLALVPVIAVIALSAPHVYDVVYRELVLPDDLVTPLPVRVAAALPLHLGALLLTWLLADAAAAMGVRRLVLERQGVGPAWLLGWYEVARRPLRVLGTAFGGAVLVALLVGPSLAAAAIGWSQVRDLLVEGYAPLIAIPAVLLWVAIWLGSLVLASVGSGIRAAAWTMIAVRPGQPGVEEPGVTERREAGSPS
jgi:hypothetical protein